MTRRSQVQVLPPLLNEGPGKRGLFCSPLGGRDAVSSYRVCTAGWPFDHRIPPDERSTSASPAVRPRPESIGDALFALLDES